MITEQGMEILHDYLNAREFVRESNRIEGIHRDPTPEEIAEHQRFMRLKKVKMADMARFVKVFQPEAKLRIHVGLDVKAGNYMPPHGGANILCSLDNILDMANAGKTSSYEIHIRYESLHPFTDCNGRSGRMLWMWMVRDYSLGFLHRFYYQTLEHSGR